MEIGSGEGKSLVGELKVITLLLAELRNKITHMKGWATSIVMFCNGKAQKDVLPFVLDF